MIPRLIALSLASLASLVSAQVVPSGLTAETLVTGLAFPTGFDFLPDRRVVFVEQRSGAVKLLANGQMGLIGVIPDVNLVHGDRGVMAVAVDPDWPTWPYLYVHYTYAPTASIRITRFTAAGDLADPESVNVSLSDPSPLLEMPDLHPFHNGGKIRFAPDGTAFVSFGDDYGHCSAQDLESRTGVILRLDFRPFHGQTAVSLPPASDLAAAGNPFVGPSAQMVWSFGTRNPYSLHLDPVSGNLYFGDVGADAWEALHEVTGPGQNFGWPFFESVVPFQSCPGLTPGTLRTPIADYPHPPFTAQAIMSFAGRYRNPSSGHLRFGPAYEGHVFYVDFYLGNVRRILDIGSGWGPASPVSGQPSPTNWASGFSLVTDSAVGPDGAIYCTRYGGTFDRIRPTGAALLPVAGVGLVGNADSDLLEDFVVEVRDAAGLSVTGVPVRFTVTQGSGTLDRILVATDGFGRAATRLHLGDTAGDVTVTATADGLTPLAFVVGWRGLVATFDAPNATVSLVASHRTPLAPLTVAVDTPTVAPHAQFPFGALWTTVALPGPSFFALDGLGISGWADPSVVADGNGVFSLTTPPLPSLGGVTFQIQSYGIDPSLPGLAGLILSNRVLLTLP